MKRKRFYRNFVIGTFFCVCLSIGAVHPAFAQDVKQVTMAPLPYDQAALEPTISANTMSFHYGKHYAAYVDKVNKLLAGSPLEGKSLVEIMLATDGRTDNQKILFNNAAQVWNHAFFWQCLKPKGGGMPEGKLADMINDSFGSFDKFKEEFINTGVSQFGSGWVWLVSEGGKLKIVATPNAENPIAVNQTPLFVVDVWEHSYYLDYQNRRADYIKGVLENLANWDFAASNI